MIGNVETNPGPTGHLESRVKVCAGCLCKADRPINDKQATTLRFEKKEEEEERERERERGTDGQRDRQTDRGGENERQRIR